MELPMLAGNNQFPTSYPGLNELLHEFVTSVQGVLGDNFIAVYLQGSFAVVDWDVYSDVDFLVAIEHDVPQSDLPALQALHARIYDLDSYWSKHLEGSYLPKETLRRKVRTDPPPLFLDNTGRELVRS